MSEEISKTALCDKKTLHGLLKSVPSDFAIELELKLNTREVELQLRGSEVTALEINYKELQQENAALMRDKKRLDWLECNLDRILLECNLAVDDFPFYVIVHPLSNPTRIGEGEDLRKCLDAAIASQPKGK